jgi:uncharacterized protein YbjT (DUF2867 family)
MLLIIIFKTLKSIIMYVIVGATGNTGKRISESLLAAGKQVTVVSRDAEKVIDLVAKGAKAAIGDLHDVAFLTQTLKGATAVYTLIPPKWDIQDWRAYQMRIATSLTLAIAQSDVKHVVNLSSQGAHLPEGAGPVSGLYYFEQMLNNVPNLNVLHLRPGYFFENLYGSSDMIKHLGILAQPFPSDARVTMVHTKDIAEMGAKRLLNLDFEGSSIQFIGGTTERTFGEVVSIVGKTIGKDVHYVVSSPEDFVNGMKGVGIPETIGLGYAELYKALNTPQYLEGFTRNAENTTPTSFEWFVENEYKYVFN